MLVIHFLLTELPMNWFDCASAVRPHIQCLTFFHVVEFGSGQPVDAFAQPPPGPWDIPAKTPNFFVDGKQIIKVPYTSSVKVNLTVI